MNIAKKMGVYFPKNIEIRNARKDIIENIVTISHGIVIFSEKNPLSELLFFLSLKSYHLCFYNNIKKFLFRQDSIIIDSVYILHKFQYKILFKFKDIICDFSAIICYNTYVNKNFY